jgi:hypothetical protein
VARRWASGVGIRGAGGAFRHRTSNDDAQSAVVLNRVASLRGARPAQLFLDDLPRDDRFLDDRWRGTLAPFFRASDRPMAMACLRLVTFPPRPPFPLFSVPRLRRRIALSTRFEAARPYFRRPDFRADFLAAMNPPA